MAAVVAVASLPRSHVIRELLHSQGWFWDTVRSFVIGLALVGTGLLGHAYYDHHDFDPADWFPRRGGPASTPASWDFSFIWPVIGPVSDPYSTFHGGVNIDQFTNYGGPVASAAPGEVIGVGDEGGLGMYVDVRHVYVHQGQAFEYQTRYGHLAEVWVKEGQRIMQGTVVGGVGCTGSCTSPNLYFEIRRVLDDGTVIRENPEVYLP